MENMQTQEALARERRKTIKELGGAVMANLSSIGIGRKETDEGAVPCLMVNGVVDYPEEVKAQITETAAPVPVTFGHTGHIRAQSI